MALIVVPGTWRMLISVNKINQGSNIIELRSQVMGGEETRLINT